MSDLGFEMPDDTETELDLPATLPILALKDTVVFPQALMPLAIGQERSIRLIDDVVSGDRFLALVTARDASIDSPGFDDIYEVGTVAVVHKMIQIPDGTLRILVGGAPPDQARRSDRQRALPRGRVRRAAGRRTTTRPKSRR